MKQPVHPTQYFLGVKDPAQNAEITVTHVCHTWRVSALSCPALWAYISSSNPTYIKTFIDRSKPLPVAIQYDTRPTLTSKICKPLDVTRSFQTIHEQLHRVTKLSISSQWDTVQEMLLRDTQSPRTLPLLEFLHLDLATPRNSGFPSFSVGQWFLSHDLPSLKYLDITEPSFKWWTCQNSLSSLTHLYINMFNDVSSEVCNLAVIFACLRRFHSLKVLDLRGVLPVDPRGGDPPELQVPPDSSPIPMPHLQSLNLSSRLAIALRVLGHLRLTAMASVHVSLSGMSFESIEESAQHLIPFFRGDGILSDNRPMVSFAVFHKVNFDSVFLIASRDDPDNLVTPAAHSHFRLSFNLFGLKPLPLIINACRSLHDMLTTVKIVRIEELEMQIEDFFAMFPVSLGIQKLGLIGDDVFLTEDILLKENEHGEHGVERQPNLAFSQLEALHIEDCEFEETDEGEIDKLDFYKCLGKAIQTRKDRGLGPNTVILDDCGIDEGDKIVEKYLSPLVKVIVLTSPETPENEDNGNPWIQYIVDEGPVDDGDDGDLDSVSTATDD